MKKSTQIVLKKAGVTALSSIASYIALCIILSLVYGLFWGHHIELDTEVLSLEKREVQKFMVNYVWISLYYIAYASICAILLAATALLPAVIFRAIYVSGNKSIQRKEKQSW